MSLDILGPGSTTANVVTARPAKSTTWTAVRTWFQDCFGGAQNGTAITADFLNDLLAQFRSAIDSSGIVGDNADDMFWRIFEVMSAREGTDTGAANHLVTTNTPPVPAFRPGMVHLVKVLHNNTGPTDYAPDGEGPFPIVHFADASAMAGGELLAGMRALLVGDDAGNMVLINSAASGGGGGGGGGTPVAMAFAGFSGLTGSAPGATKTATWHAAEIAAKVAAGASTTYIGAAVTLNLNAATTGANGMDTGALPAAVTDVCAYAIYNPTSNTWASLMCLLSTSTTPVYSGANMPAGYTASVLIFSGKTDVSGNLPLFSQVDRRVSVGDDNATTGYGIWTNIGSDTISLVPIVPANAKTVSGSAWATVGSESAAGDFSVSALNQSGIFTARTSASGAPGVLTISVTFNDLPLSTPQQIFAEASVGNVQGVIANYTF